MCLSLVDTVSLRYCQLSPFHKLEQAIEILAANLAALRQQ